MERNSLVNWQERKTGNWEKQNFGLVTWSKKSEIADEILEGATKRALTSYRVAWEDAIDYISGETKEKIIKAAKNIPLYMNIDSEGNVWVRFILGNKQWAYMYPELINHTDDIIGITVWAYTLIMKAWIRNISYEILPSLLCKSLNP